MIGKVKGIRSLLFFYLPVFCVQFISGRVTIASSNSWYQNLNKGYWTPPAWFFGPTWTLLYVMMTCAVWMIYRAEAKRRQYRLAYFLFFTQLIVNAFWSILFFKLHMPGLALVDLGLLSLLVTTTVIYFFRIRPLAGLFLFPYLLWILYAFSLNAAICWLN